jgi:nucleoid-associated protein YgaU
MPLLPVSKLDGNPPGAPQPAIITGIWVKKQEQIPCMFRPRQLSFLKNNSWEETTSLGSEVSRVHFNGGKAVTFSLELFFDTYETREDVREKYTDKIWNLMKIDEDTARGSYKGNPPLCEFSWGMMSAFQAVITKIDQKFTMFLADGTPVRATLNVDFLQAEEIDMSPKQDPSTTSVPKYKARRVKQGETIDGIASQEYGDSSLWRVIADDNRLGDPMQLTPGQLLIIPPKP